jgi:hypothetical protein
MLLLFSVFHHARRDGVNSNARKAFVALGSHRASPMSKADKRCDVDGSCVIVAASWSLVAAGSEIATHFAVLPEKLSFAHLTTLSLRGPPPMPS